MLSVWDSRRKILHNNGSACNVGQTSLILPCEVSGTKCYGNWVRVSDSFICPVHEEPSTMSHPVLWVVAFVLESFLYSWIISFGSLCFTAIAHNLLLYIKCLFINDIYMWHRDICIIMSFYSDEIFTKTHDFWLLFQTFLLFNLHQAPALHLAYMYFHLSYMYMYSWHIQNCHSCALIAADLWIA